MSPPFEYNPPTVGRLILGYVSWEYEATKDDDLVRKKIHEACRERGKIFDLSMD